MSSTQNHKTLQFSTHPILSTYAPQSFTTFENTLRNFQYLIIEDEDQMWRPQGGCGMDSAAATQGSDESQYAEGLYYGGVSAASDAIYAGNSAMKAASRRAQALMASSDRNAGFSSSKSAFRQSSVNQVATSGGMTLEGSSLNFASGKSVGFDVILRQKKNELINLELPIFQFQSTYFISVENQSTFAHYINRERRFKLPFIPHFYFESKPLPVENTTTTHVQPRTSNGVLLPPPTQSFAYFISQDGEICRMDSTLSIEVLQAPLADSQPSIRLYSASDNFIALFDSSKSQILLYSLKLKKMSALTLPESSKKYVTKMEIMETSIGVTLFLYSQDSRDDSNSGTLDIYRVQSNDSEMMEAALREQQEAVSRMQDEGDEADSLNNPLEKSVSWEPSLHRIGAQSPLRRREMIAIRPLPILQREFGSDDSKFETLTHVLLVFKSNDASHIAFEIVNLLQLVSLGENDHTRKAFSRHPIQVVPSYPVEDYLDVKIPPESILMYGKHITSFGVQMLCKKAIYTFDFLTGFEGGLQYITSLGPDIFSQKDQVEIFSRLEQYGMLKPIRKLYPHHAVEHLSSESASGQSSERQAQRTAFFHLLLDMLWEYDLTSIITQYITCTKQNEIGRDIYILHNPLQVYNWVKDLFSRIKIKAIEYAKEYGSTRSRALTVQERSLARQNLSQSIRELTSVLLIVESLGLRAQDSMGQRDVDSFCAHIERCIDYIRVFEWFLGQGFIPAAVNRFNTEAVQKHWNQEVMTFSLQRVTGFDRENLKPIRETVSTPNFVSLLISKCANTEFEYPPQAITKMSDLFLDNQERFQYESRQQTTEELKYNHLLMIYFLFHMEMSGSSSNQSPNFDLISLYARQFNITDGWQELIYAFYQMDTNTTSFPETINHLCNTDPPIHEWHQEIVCALFYLEEYLAANMYMDKVPDGALGALTSMSRAYDASLQLHCLLARNLLTEALELQRQPDFEESWRREALLADIIQHCIESKLIDKFFAYNLDDFEKDFLVRYLRKQQLKDVLFSYYVLQHRFVDAVALYKDNAPQNAFTRATLNNILTVLPKAQRAALYSRTTQDKAQTSSSQHSILGNLPLFTTGAIRGVREPQKAEASNPENSGVIRKRDDMEDDDEEGDVVIGRPLKR